MSVDNGEKLRDKTDRGRGNEREREGGNSGKYGSLVTRLSRNDFNFREDVARTCRKFY